MNAARRVGSVFLGIVASVATVAPAAAGEVWAPPTHFLTPGLTFFPWPTSGSGFASFGFAIPDDFSAFTSAKVVLLPKAGLSTTFDIYGSVKGNGDVATADLLFSLAVPATLVAGTVQEVDITSLLAGKFEVASAGRDYVSVFFWFPVSPGLEEGTVLGLRFSYDGVRIQSADIETGAVTTNKLEDGAVTNAKLADDSIGPNKIVNNSLGGDEITNGSLGALDINRNEVQARVTGSCLPGESIRAISAHGEVQCEPDTAGLKGLRKETALAFCPPGPLCTLSVTCPDQRSVMGGGARVVSLVPGTVDLLSSYPSSATEWTIEVSNLGPPADITAYVLCSAEATGDSSTSPAAARRAHRPLTARP